ncbi:MAG: protein phosphatase 2C domain-containing protein [Dermatophilaceae bacterium]|nr:protein phosphatase 2C domain-containing protein [Dermatophilaceae bacterium]
MTACPICHAAVGDSEQFCEACGAELSPTTVAAEVPPEEPSPGQPDLGLPVTSDLAGAASICPGCGGEVAADGYCGTCGARAPKRRDHFSEQPAGWVAAVCDRGIRHGRNEDAVAVAADPEPGSRAVLVVCDGVSSSVDSDLASLAAARAARAVLVSSRSRGMGAGLSLIAAVTSRLEAAADAASDAVIEVTRNAKAVADADLPPAPNPASCTFVAAVVEQDLLVVGSVGDSRAYWLPDVGEAVALTLDDSFAQVRIAAGVPRAEAESGPQSHAILRWLGEDAPDHKPTTSTMTLTQPGWLLVCSDGLWNYCSEAEDLAALVRQTTGGPPEAAEPLTLADALVGWANAQGGQDNISVALARIQPG